jgi:hypothetical protein
MTTISQALNGTLALITVGREIYEQVTKFMDTVQSDGGNGANKKAWVMAAAKHLIIEVGKNWNQWEKYISDFIDAAKSVYNSLKCIFK